MDRDARSRHRPERVAASGPAPSAAQTQEAATAGPYLEGQALVRPRAGASLDAIARAHGATVLRPVGPSGMGLLRLAPGQSPADLVADPDVITVGRHARTQGAASYWLYDDQWHRGTASLPWNSWMPLSGIVVAVLDTGLAMAPAAIDQPVKSRAATSQVRLKRTPDTSSALL